MTMLVRGGAVTGSALPATATTGQVLQWNGTAWVAATPSASGTTPNATPTVPGLVQLAGDLGGTATAPTVAKIGGATPAAVATTGAYTDLTGRPALATVATSGNYTDLTGRPALATVATSGNYTDLTGRPALATVATSGSYGDLTGRPLLATVATTGAYSDLTGAPAAPILRGKAAATTTTNGSGSWVNDTDLRVASLPVGTYAFEAFLLPATSTNYLLYWSNDGVTLTGQFQLNKANGTTSTLVSNLNTSQTLTGQGATGGASLVGFVVCTQAQPFGAVYASASGGTAAGNAAGSWLRLTKVA